ncbi:MAG: DUF2239 family protein [Moraxellaceae bacterium]
MTSPQTAVTAFLGKQYFARGDLGDVVSRLKSLLDHDAEAQALVFSDADGKIIDVDFRSSFDDVSARLPSVPDAQAEKDAPRGRGRPRLGVSAREVTLLPRHWEWLAAQSGGASVALRKLVEVASRQNVEADRKRLSQEAAYRFMSAMAGDEAGFEEASRALFAGNQDDFLKAQSSWPQDIARYTQSLASAALAAS